MSKRTFGINLTVAAVFISAQVLVLAQPAYDDPPPPPPPCVENVTYGEWHTDVYPKQNDSPTNAPSVNPTTLYGNVGKAPCLPTVVPPKYDAGSKSQPIFYVCPCPDCPTANIEPIAFTVSEAKWDPPLPATWEDEGTFTHTNYVDVTGGDDSCPPPGRVDIGIVTWTIRGQWHEVATADINAMISAIKTAVNGVKAAASVGPCDVKELKLSGEIKLQRRTLYCDCHDSQTRMESKLDPAKVTLTLSKIECPVPTLCLPPLKLGKFGKAAAGLYATYSGSWDAGLRVQVAEGCQNDSLCGLVNGSIEAGFKVKAEVCWQNPEIGAEASGSATATIGVNFECCHNDAGSFAVEVKPLKLAYVIKANVVGWKKTFAKGEVNVFKGGQLGPYTFNCPV